METHAETLGFLHMFQDLFIQLLGVWFCLFVFLEINILFVARPVLELVL